MDKGKSVIENGNDRHAPTRVRRILLCETNLDTCNDMFSLLTKCSYQVNPVYSEAEMMDALNSWGADRTDLILAEATLLMTSGAKILHYIMQDKALQHIPIIMMLGGDEVDLMLKGLRFGATDYVMKPLSATDVSNLGAHMHKTRPIIPPIT